MKNQISQTNVEVIKSVYDALARQDIPTLFGLFAPDIRVTQSPDLPWGGDYSGLNGAKEFLQRVKTHLDSHVVLGAVIEAGDHVVFTGRTEGIVKTKGHSFNAAFVHVWSLRDGKIVRFQPYVDYPSITGAPQAQTETFPMQQ